MCALTVIVPILPMPPPLRSPTNLLISILDLSEISQSQPFCHACLSFAAAGIVLGSLDASLDASLLCLECVGLTHESHFSIFASFTPLFRSAPNRPH